MATCMKLMLLVVVGVLATLVCHADSRSPIPPPFHCKYYCKIRDGPYECCDGIPTDGRCRNPNKVFVNIHSCLPGYACAAIFAHKKCGTITDRCSGNEFCCPIREDGGGDFACAFLRY
ncbi:uncharacterized protein LOC143028584 [Oratosquilla oratoria]|uniref:uncharacterized protein LOC143028584 n=1 Tax=Oratosquilla oratoria TaxID=337810 RepID=UPI003F768DB9